MTFAMPTLSHPFTEAPADHNVIVIGSGYGGGVAASRIARTGQAVTVLERGREVHPGDYPREMSHMTSEFQYRLSKTGEVLGDPQGLFDWRINDDVNVLVGCGLGGTSLINANVAIEVDKRVFAGWPEPYRSNPDLLGPYYDRARDMLGSTPYPHDPKPKLKALKAVADGLDAPCSCPDINVTFDAQANKAGLWQAPCNDCGDCVSGCNYGAKNTVLMNYLLDAWRHDAQIYTGAEVTRIHKHGDGWIVMVGEVALTAKLVILAAGTLGSTEILLRSQTSDASLSPYDALNFSPRLGQSFSGNGDVWALGYNANIPDGDGRAPVYGIGAGDCDIAIGTPDCYRPGPCITGMIDLRNRTDRLEDGLIIEEGVLPGALAMSYAAGFPMLDALMGDPFRFGDVAQRLQDVADIGAEVMDNPASLAEMAYTGPVSRTLPFLVMSHDASEGTLRLRNDSVYVDWPNAGLDPALVGDAEVLKAASDAIAAEFLPMPFWQDALGNRAMAVHPIGGCGMGDDVTAGVIDADCAVFDASGGVHKGLYVMDGAALPGGVGVNPHLAITAVAERAVERLCANKKWVIDWTDLPPLDQQIVPEASFNWITVLGQLIDGMRNCIAASRKPDKSDARSYLKTLWGMIKLAYDSGVTDETKAAFPMIDAMALSALLSDEAFPQTVVPILLQCLEVAEPLKDALTDGTDPMSVLTAHMGDFSPPGVLFETMVGRISDVGLADCPQPSDPHGVAARAGTDCTLYTDMRGETVDQVLTPPNGLAQIVRGTFEAPSLGGIFDVSGTFAFLMPNPNQVECWEMRYEGVFTPRDHEGPDLRFCGIKTLQRRDGSHWWTDLTEINLDICNDKTPVAKGVLTVTLEEAMRQAKSIQIAYGDGDLRDAFAQVYADLQCDAQTIHKLPLKFQDGTFRANLVKGAAFLLDDQSKESKAQSRLENRSKRQIAARVATLVARCYGSIFAYMANFPAQEAGEQIAPADLMTPEVFTPDIGDGQTVKLTRYQGGPKGPVILAGGFGTKASSFALSTVKTNLVQYLNAHDYDVWLFDYRGSGDIASSRSPFTIDDVALVDWPAAISCVLENTPETVKDVQVIAHCIGSMSLFMALLAGENRVRSVVGSQTGPHAVTNWANYAKADSELARYIGEGLPETMWGLVDMMNLGPVVSQVAKKGLTLVDARSPSDIMGDGMFDQTVDGLLWNAPLSTSIECYSPTCHRVNFFFGPSYYHPQLNQDTHNAIRHLFGPVHPKPFQHISAMFEAGYAQSFDRKTNYLDGVSNLTMPIHFIAGARNQEMMPEATLRSLKWLHDAFPDHKSRYTRKVFQDYGHMDFFIGKSASDVIFPHLLDVLNATA